jgi:hypothetical protein
MPQKNIKAQTAITITNTGKTKTGKTQQNSSLKHTPTQTPITTDLRVNRDTFTLRPPCTRPRTKTLEKFSLFGSIFIIRSVSENILIVVHMFEEITLFLFLFFFLSIEP